MDTSIDLAEASEVTGESHPCSGAVSITVRRPGGRNTVLSIPAADLPRLVQMLLLLGRALPFDRDSAPAALSLVPTDTVSVGQLPGGETLLAVGVGPSTVGLSLPSAAALELGRSLLAAAADETVVQ